MMCRTPSEEHAMDKCSLGLWSQNKKRNCHRFAPIERAKHKCLERLGSRQTPGKTFAINHSNTLCPAVGQIFVKPLRNCPSSRPGRWVCRTDLEKEDVFREVTADDGQLAGALLAADDMQAMGEALDGHHRLAGHVRPRYCQVQVLHPCKQD